MRDTFRFPINPVCTHPHAGLIGKFSNWLNKMVTRPSRQKRQDSTKMVGTRSIQELMMVLDYEYRK